MSPRCHLPIALLFAAMESASAAPTPAQESKASAPAQGKAALSLGRSRLATPHKVAALTFDDGPDPRFTSRILDELKRQRIRATFFLIGEQVKRYPEIARRIVAEGHIVGNHSYTHPWLDRMPEAILDAELRSCDRIIRQVTGQRPRVFRAPRGNLTPAIMRKAKALRYKAIQWSVCADNKEAKTPAQMADRVFRHAQPGMIVLIHDGRMEVREKDVQATPLIIAGLRKMGYSFVPLAGKWLQ